jgi:hypothetical protein
MRRFSMVPAENYEMPLRYLRYGGYQSQSQSQSLAVGVNTHTPEKGRDGGSNALPHLLACC